MCLGGGDGGAGAAAAAQREEEDQRQGRIRSGMANIDQIFSPFNDTFFKGRSQAFLDFARPQLEDQYRKARENLIFALSRNGLLQSSAGATKFGELTKLYDTNRQVIEGRGADEGNRARQQVEENRSDLVNQLHATSDPTAAANAAIARQSFLSSTPGFDALGNLFQNITAGLADATNTPQNRFSGVGLFDTGRTSRNASSRVVGG
jgi:hypothetical protein